MRALMGLIEHHLLPQKSKPRWRPGKLFGYFRVAKNQHFALVYFRKLGSNSGMKNLFLLTVVFFFSSFAAQAITLSDLMGNWKSSGDMYQNNTLIGKAVGTGKFTKYGTKGAYSVATVTVNGVSATGQMWMLETGELLGCVKQGNTTIGILSGSWSIKNNAIIQNISANTLNQNYTQSVEVKIINKNKISSISTTSTGLRAVGMLVR